MGNIASWFRKNVITRYVMTNGCPEKQKCFEILETYLDGEATEEETEHAMKMLDGCWHCYKEYELDKVLKTMVQENGYDNKEVPVDLIENIRTKIQNH